MKSFVTLIGVAATLSFGSAETTIAHQFDVTTFSGGSCNGTNQGETVVRPGAHQCVNYSNAGSFRIHKAPDISYCAKVKSVKFHNTGCTGASYGTFYFFPNGGSPCIPLNQANNPGSAKFSCDS